MTTRGAGLVARQEIRTRLRTGRWKTLLAVWFVIVNGLGLLFRFALEAGGTSDFGSEGVPMFGGVLLGVLVLTLLVTPALSGQSINGDRERGTLAALQVTRLTPGDIALGKFAAAWGTGLLTLLLTLPCVLWPVLEGAVGAGRAAVVLAVMALLIGVVCAVSLAWSALVARSVTSVLLSYVTVFALLVGTPLLFLIGLPLTAEHRRSGTYEDTVDHSERVWWLLAPNPVVVLADAAPRLPKRRIVVDDQVYERAPESDPLGDISREVRDARRGPYNISSSGEPDGASVWPYGLLFDLALGAGALRLTAARLRTPLYRVPRGVRVA
ncbi:ABC transporter permease [Actinomadura syzygii]|uniref:ABC transporter permease subunit n=1 Tax=Actinomadura syzygii TaxID=1427538 RepID=A0A5D0TT68_9ACTN|nr:ABC transporter permease subunit [Actinomadura syzygii]TYC09521.1 ABC transporter permease subunit [Actinomadura syzygii]